MFHLNSWCFYLHLWYFPLSFWRFSLNICCFPLYTVPISLNVPNISYVFLLFFVSRFISLNAPLKSLVFLSSSLIFPFEFLMFHSQYLLFPSLPISVNVPKISYVSLFILVLLYRSLNASLKSRHLLCFSMSLWCFCLKLPYCLSHCWIFLTKSSNPKFYDWSDCLKNFYRSNRAEHLSIRYLIHWYCSVIEQKSIVRQSQLRLGLTDISKFPFL